MLGKFKSKREIAAQLRNFKKFGFCAEQVVKSKNIVVHAILKDRGVIEIVIPKSKAGLSVRDEDFN